MPYKCIECNLETTLLSNYNRHLNTQKHKKAMIKSNLKQAETENNSLQTTQIPHKFLFDHTNTTQNHTNTTQIPHKYHTNILPPKCHYCYKIFSRIDSLNRHISRYCKEKKKLDKEKSEMKLIIEAQKNKIETLEKCTTNITNVQVNSINSNNSNSNNTNSNNTNNSNNNVKLNYFGKENLSMLTDDVKKELIKGPFTMMPRLMEIVYFNDKFPENHTIKLANKNKELMKIHQKKGWKFKDKKETIEYILEDKNYEVDSYYDENEEDFSNFVKKTYNKFRELFDSRDTSLWRKIKRDIDIVLWNNM